jgi:hypothetical protein
MAPVEIPPAAIEAACAIADDDWTNDYTEHTPAGEVTWDECEAQLRAALPHLFASWSERLMDEGRVAVVRRARALQRGRATPVDAVTLGDELVRAALAALVPENRKDRHG